VASFSWGGVNGMTTFEVSKAIDVAEEVYKRREMVLSEMDKKILSIFLELLLI